MQNQISFSLIALAMLAFYGQSSSAQPQVEIDFVGGFGGYGKTQAGKFDWPIAIAFDAQGLIIIADNNNHRVQRCNAQGDCEVIGSEGSSLGQFKWPLGVAVDSQNRMIISEAGNDRIQLRTPAGQWSSFGSNGLGGPPGEFRLPAGIALDKQEKIVIADEKNNRIQICNDTGICSAFGSFGSTLGQFNTPRAVAVTSTGRILVADFKNDRIQNCSYAGECTSFGGRGSEPGKLLRPSGVTVDSEDRVFVSERDNYRFQICDLNGACVAFGEFGSGPGQFKQLEAIAVDGQNRIYVADVINQNIQIFQATYNVDPQPDSFHMNAGLNDAWYNPATSGQGFFITVFPDLGAATLAWFTYDTELPADDAPANLGDPGHRWLTALGPIEGNRAIMEIEMTSGGLFDSATEVTRTDPPGSDGTITLTFDNCNSGTIEYDIPSIDQQGVVNIVRVANDNVALCETLEAALHANK